MSLSKTKKNTLNPKWNEEVLIKIIPSEHKLSIGVFDWDTYNSHDFMGMVELELTKIPRENMPNASINSIGSYDLKPRDGSKVKGFLELYHAFIDPYGPEYQTKMDEGLKMKSGGMFMKKKKNKKGSFTNEITFNTSGP